MKYVLPGVVSGAPPPPPLFLDYDTIHAYKEVHIYMTFLLLDIFSSCSIPPHPISCSDQVEACGDDPDVGYTTNHVPEASTPLDEMFDATLINGDDTDLIDSNFSVNCTPYLGE